MACTNQPPLNETQRAAIDLLDAIDTRLYYLQHLCDLISGCAAVGGIAEQTELKAETLQVVFGWLAAQMKEIRNLDMESVRKAVAR